MEKQFGIKISDGSTVLSTFGSKSNENFLTLYDWQKRAIDFFFKNNHLAIYEVCTGAGKTLMAIELIKLVWEKSPKTDILIVVPKNIIMESGWYKELFEAGIKLQDIGVYYGKIKEYGKITITNMQNIDRISLELFDMVIWDEVHNYGTKKMLEYLKHPFKYRVGLSATVIRSDNAHYNIKSIFDYNIFKYTPKQGLVDGVLNPFNFIDISVEMDDDSYEKYLKITQEINMIMKACGGFYNAMRRTDAHKLKLLKLMGERKQMVANYYKKFDVIRWVCQKHEKNKIVIFNEFNSQTNKCYWHLLDVGIKARVMHSGIKSNKRTEDLSDFKNDVYNTLLVTRVVDEGWNLPKIDVGVIMAGNSSARQTIQRLGRILRKKNDSSTLYQIYCKNTIEEKYSLQRSELFQEICSDYKYYTLEDLNEHTS